MGKKKILAAFLEKDNLKLLVYEGKERVFAGQISFAPEVVRDGFIADGAKFASQVKVAIAAKPALQEPAEVLLFLSPDKVFTKTLAVTDSVDGFVHGLPYFKEELIINSETGKDKVTYTAFEKKLVEDLQRPFLESGKKVVGVKSEIGVLVSKFPVEGKYLLLLPLEKEVVTIVASDGEIVDLAVVRNEVYTARFGEFISSHNLVGLHQVYTVGILAENLAAKLRQENNLEIVPLAQTDIYDLIVYSSSGRRGGLPLEQIMSRLPNQKFLLLAGAVLVGMLLMIGLLKTLGATRQTGKPAGKVTSPVSPAVPTPPPAPVPKPGDFTVDVFNGTLLTGEAGRLAENLKGLGFNVGETKNATTSGFVATRLRVASGVPDKITADLKTVLTETYESVDVEPLVTSSGKAQIEIIIGKKKP